MTKAIYSDKDLVLSILAASFVSNQSVNYILKKDKKRDRRIRALMDYSFEVCCKFGDIFITSDKSACALIVYPDKKKITINSIRLDIKLIFRCVGVQNIRKTLQRETLIKRVQANETMTYLWFIGVHPAKQRCGVGSRLLMEIVEFSKLSKRPIYLETSTVENLPWYQKFGFNIYHQEDLGYNLYFLNNKSG